MRTSKRRIIGAKYPKCNKKYYQDIREYAHLINKETELGEHGRTEEDKVVFLGKQKSNEEQQRKISESLHDLISQVGIDSLQFEDGNEIENWDSEKRKKGDDNQYEGTRKSLDNEARSNEEDSKKTQGENNINTPGNDNTNRIGKINRKLNTNSENTQNEHKVKSTNTNEHTKVNTTDVHNCIIENTEEK